MGESERGRGSSEERLLDRRWKPLAMVKNFRKSRRRLKVAGVERQPPERDSEMVFSGLGRPSQRKGQELFATKGERLCRSMCGLGLGEMEIGCQKGIAGWCLLAQDNHRVGGTDEKTYYQRGWSMRVAPELGPGSTNGNELA